MRQKFKYIFFTLIHLKLAQIVFYVKRRFLPSRNDIQASNILNSEFRHLSLNRTLYSAFTGTQLGEFCFLNVLKHYKRLPIEWGEGTVSLLWLYNLHYFDYLHEKQRPIVDGLTLIDDWVENNHIGSYPGWEPYPTSLRVVNWIKLFVQEGERCVSKSRINNLFEQVVWLEKKLELHILANHFFENIKALAFAGMFFKGDIATQWQNKATKYLLRELSEQILKDGGHYERSPQYHCIMLENYLDLLNLISNNPGTKLDLCRSKLTIAIVSGLKYLQEIILSDGSIPLFNDSVYGSSPSPNELLNYANSLGLDAGRGVDESRLVSVSDSGVYGYVSKSDSLLIDCGDIGPAYQPGHTHCDFLSYVFMLDKQMIVVDTGVYEYTPGEMRNYVRSTKAHNTVSVDGDEQSEIWGEFRVARRAKKIMASIERKKIDRILFEGEYAGFYGVKGGVRHNRCISVKLEDGHENIFAFTVTDNVYGKGKHTVESYIHIHPDVLINDLGHGSIRLTCTKGQQIIVTVDPNCSYIINSSLYCPEFGKKIANKVITLSYEGFLPCEISYDMRRV